MSCVLFFLSHEHNLNKTNCVTDAIEIIKWCKYILLNSNYRCLILVVKSCFQLIRHTRKLYGVTTLFYFERDTFVWIINSSTRIGHLSQTTMHVVPSMDARREGGGQVLGKIQSTFFLFECKEKKSKERIFYFF